LLKQLRWHIGCADIHATFYVGFFHILKYVQNAFQTKGAYTRGAKMACPETIPRDDH
jgi:hypothetical protein